MQPFAFTPWNWRDPEVSGTPDEQAAQGIAGYRVEATDGHIGSIDEASYEVGGAYVVVDTGPWIFGRKVLLPAGTVQRVDRDEHRVHIDRTKDQIKESPEYDKDTFTTPQYRQEVGDYYTASYRQYPPL